MKNYSGTTGIAGVKLIQYDRLLIATLFHHQPFAPESLEQVALSTRMLLLWLQCCISQSQTCCLKGSCHCLLQPLIAILVPFEDTVSKLTHESWVEGMRFTLASKGETLPEVPDVDSNREVVPLMEKIVEFRAPGVQVTTVSISAQNLMSELINSGKFVHDVIRHRSLEIGWR